MDKAGPAPHVLDKRDRAVEEIEVECHSWLLLVLLVELLSFHGIRKGFQNGYMSYSLTKQVSTVK